jgi:hypothetical protein
MMLGRTVVIVDVSAQHAELRRQTEFVAARGLPALAGLSEAAFRRLVAPLVERLSDLPFVLVVTGALVPLNRLIELSSLRGTRGFTTMIANAVARLRPTADAAAPDVRWPYNNVGRHLVRAQVLPYLVVGPIQSGLILTIATRSAAPPAHADRASGAT